MNVKMRVRTSLWASPADQLCAESATQKALTLVTKYAETPDTSSDVKT